MRMKSLSLLALVLCVILVLQGCAQQPEVEGLIVAGQQTPQPAATQVVVTQAPSVENESENFDDGTYDPSSEEDATSDMLGVLTETNTEQSDNVTPAPTISSQYAGATPLLLDPIDKPTDTPVPALSFSYQTYEASNIRLKFEAPEGWDVDDSLSDTYVLTNPDQFVDYQARIILRAVSVNATMSASEMAEEVKQIISTEKGNYSSFSSTKTASRTFLEKKGYYANYSGTTLDGIEVAGRVQVTCIEKTMYTVHITYPKAYTDTYTHRVYNKLRATVKTF